MIGYTIFFITLGVLLHFINSRVFIFYYLITYFFVPYLLSLVLVAGHDDVSYFTNHLPLYLIIIYLIELVKNKFKHKNQIATLFFVVIIIYIVFNAFIHTQPISEYLIHFVVSFLVPLFCFSNLIYWRRIQWASVDLYIWTIYILEIIIAIVQVCFGFLVPSHMLDSVTKSNICGTFAGGNAFGMYICLFTIYVLCREGERKFKYVLVLISFLCVLLSGVRTYLVCFIIFIPLCIYIKKGNRSKKVKSALLAVFIFLPFLFLASMNLNGLNTRDAENPIQRQIYGLSNFSRGEAATADQSTMFLSLYVFSEYFFINPIWGNWQLYTDSSYDLVSPENRNVMDAGLAVYISDIGILGMLLYLMFQIATFSYRIREKVKKEIVILYAYALLITYTDIGIFGGTFMCCLFLVACLLNKEIV